MPNIWLRLFDCYSLYSNWILAFARDFPLYRTYKIELMELKEDMLNILNEILKLDPAGESAIYKYTFSRAIALGVIDEEGNVIENIQN